MGEVEREIERVKGFIVAVVFTISKDRERQQLTVTHPFESIKIKKGWGQEEDQSNRKINLSECYVTLVQCNIIVTTIFLSLRKVTF